MIAFLALLSASLSVQPARAQVTDDSDLSGGRSPAAGVLWEESRAEEASTVFRAEQIAPPPAGRLRNASIEGIFLLTGPEGRDVPASRAKALLVSGSKLLAESPVDENGAWELAAPPNFSGKAVVRLRLENAAWSIQDARSGKPYSWDAAEVQLPAAGVRLGTYRPDPSSENGKIGLIHLQFLEAFSLFERAGVGTDWWKERLAVSYPDSADYFSPWGFDLHLTRAEQWDVNLHEFGHAVMAAGTRSYGGGGQHKIDECYNAGLAWSEGWATFFAGAARLSPSDPDAKFQYLVPRRAPIRLENVPEDVCKGPTSEWRVAAGLWDLHDMNVDGRDASALGFARIWKAIAAQRIGSFADAWGFISAGLPPDALAAGTGALRQNTLLPEAVRPAPARSAVELLSVPAWD